MMLSKSYNPSEHEEQIYKLWEGRGLFTPAPEGEGRYSLVMPPPNANGNLHLGHGLTLGIEDVAARFHRMKGKSTLFVPGADHAGFETWVVYEKLLNSQGKSRFDYTREELYQQIWEFVAQNKTNFESQFRRLGASLDWNRYTYTLDKKIVATAYATFKRMFDEGLMYRAEKLVNYCTKHDTGFADIEVSYKDVKGSLWHIAYPLTDGEGEIVVATTRPETMLGDTAVAVHPQDKRYIKYHGKTVKLPLTEREIPIITDEMVDMSFGSGAVKITPSHDQTDYEVAHRHDLPFITVIDHLGNITGDMPERYRGLPVAEARKSIVTDLSQLNLVRNIEDYSHSVGHCYKCDTVIEPLLREQWFIGMDKLAAPAIQALERNEITFYPDNKRLQLIDYLKNLRDWNVSRQIAWGIPIPAFQNIDQPDEWIFDEEVDKELIERNGKTYHRDPDVFDTWFSSSSWPYATLGYPDADDYKKFYPLDLMETAADILYPWVSRMIMFGLYTTGKIPFKTVYLHGLVLDEHGQKMSKSKGNVVDPNDKIKQFGSDAMRMGLLIGQTAGSNQPYVESRLVGARNFCNKLWNISRYIQDKVGSEYQHRGNAKPITQSDHWIVHRLGQCAKLASQNLDDYQFAEAYDAIYHFVWDDLADWYIEASKVTCNPSLLAYVLEQSLALVHPFAPHVTEAIWQSLAWEADSLIATHEWPEIDDKLSDNKLVAQFEYLRRVTTEVRAIVSALDVSKPHLYYSDMPSELKDQIQTLVLLARLSGASQVKEGKGVKLSSTDYSCWLDIDKQSIADHIERLGTLTVNTQSDIDKLKQRLNNPSYVDNAPADIVKQTKTQLEKALQDLVAIQKELEEFSSLV